MLVDWKQYLNVASEKHISYRFEKSYNSGKYKNKEKRVKSTKQQAAWPQRNTDVTNIVPRVLPLLRESIKYTSVTMYGLWYVQVCWIDGMAENYPKAWKEE